MPARVDEQRILDAALEIWRERGLRDATTRKVAERAGIGEVTLFRRFGTKSALFAAALAREAERFETDGVGYTGELRADLLAITHAYRRMLDRNIAIVGDFLTRVDRDPAFAAVGEAPLQAMLRVAQILARHQAEGRLEPGAPSTLLLALLSPMVMELMLAHAQAELGVAMDPEAHVDHFIRGWGRSRD